MTTTTSESGVCVWFEISASARECAEAWVSASADEFDWSDHSQLPAESDFRWLAAQLGRTVEPDERHAFEAAFRAALDELADLPSKCQCGEITGQFCDMRPSVTIEHVWPSNRGLHTAGGSRGEWPANGSVRLCVHPLCAADLADDWTALVTP